MNTQNHINNAKNILSNHIQKECNINCAENSFFKTGFPFFCISNIKIGNFQNISNTAQTCLMNISIFSKSADSDEIIDLSSKVHQFLSSSANLNSDKNIDSFISTLSCNNVSISEMSDIRIWKSDIETSVEIRLYSRAN